MTRDVRSAVLFLLLAALPLASACKAPQAFGERDSIIVRADSALWSQVDSAVISALEQRVFTTRPERIFEVTFVAANDTLWDEFRLWQQVVVIGTRGDEAVERALRASDNRDARPPALAQAEDVWALDQLVTVVLLPDQDPAGALAPLLPRLYELLRARYDEWVTARMYTTGVNDSLKQALAVFGFTLELPRVYLHFQHDSVFRFGNPYRQAESDILRSLLVTWAPGGGVPSADSLRAWRQRIAETEYEPGQDILETGLRSGRIRVGGLEGVELRGVWQDRSDFPAAGPFIARAIPCPTQNRTYYMDAWLFAPGKDKFPYLRQLEILLDSFRCSAAAPAASAGTTATPVTG